MSFKVRLAEKFKMIGSLSVGKPLAKIEVYEIEGGHKIRITDPDGVQELDLMDGKDADNAALSVTEIGGVTYIMIPYDDGYKLIPLMDNDCLIKPDNLPAVTKNTKGAMTPEQMKKLEELQSAGIYFEEVGTDTLNYKEDTRGLETYDSCYKASDAAPTYEELLKGIAVAYVYTDPAGTTIVTVTPTISYYEADGYCKVLNQGVYAYVVYEGNTLGVSAGTYFARSTRSMTVNGYTGFEPKKTVLKAECLPNISGGLLAPMARIGEITLFAADWEGEASPYSQIVEVDGVTGNSQVDLTPSVEQLAIFHEKDLAFVTENEGGTVTVYAVGQKPQNDYTIQVTITEVAYE